MFLTEAFHIVQATLEQDRDKRPHGAALEALLEIEECFKAALAETNRVRAEIERLRAALTYIMELGYHSLDPNVDKRMTDLAREALK